MTTSNLIPVLTPLGHLVLAPAVAAGTLPGAAPPMPGGEYLCADVLVALCKHVAATLYGIGARLDAEPELLFGLRQVDALINRQPRERSRGLLVRRFRAAHHDALFGAEGEPDTHLSPSVQICVTPSRTLMIKFS